VLVGTIQCDQMTGVGSGEEAGTCERRICVNLRSRYELGGFLDVMMLGSVVRNSINRRVVRVQRQNKAILGRFFCVCSSN